jgi:hypothetical protein
MDGPVRQGIWIDERIAVPCQRAGDFGGAPSAWAVDETRRPLRRTTRDPLAQGSRGKGAAVRDGLQTLPWHDVAPSVGTAEDAGVFGLLEQGISGRERLGGNVQCEGPHLRVSNNTLLHK